MVDTLAIPATTKVTKLRAELGFVDILGHFAMWVGLIIITLGFGAFFFPYYLNRYMFNKTVVVNADGKTLGRMVCDFELSHIIGHIIMWMLISIVTLGIGYIFYFYHVRIYCINRTRIEQE